MTTYRICKQRQIPETVIQMFEHLNSYPKTCDFYNIQPDKWW